MSSTTYFLRRFILLLLVLNCLHPVLVLGQDETTPAPNPAPEPTTREPPPEPTTRDPPPTTRQDPPTSRPEPTTRVEPTESPTDPPTTPTPTTVPPSTDLPTTTPPPDGTITSSPPATSSMTVSSPQPNGPTCQQECLAGTAATLGCANMADRACICPQLASYTNAANTCMENNNCGPAAQAIGEVQRMCQSNTMSGTPSTSPTPRNPPSPGPTVGTQGGTGVNGQLTTQTQTLVLTAGQVVTLPVSGTVQTTFTASSALTTTRIATMLEQAGFGGSGSDGASGGAMGLRVGCGMSVVVGVVGVMVGAVFVL